MGFIVEWVSNIVVFILFATVLSMILPNSNMGKYVKMVVGLLLITIILNPLFQLFRADIAQVISSFKPETYIANGEVENQLNLTKSEIEDTQRAYILKQMAVQLKEQVQKDVFKQFNQEVVSVEVVPKENIEAIQSNDDIQVVNVKLKEGQPTSSETIGSVKEVVIDATASLIEKETTILAKEEILALLSEKWGIAQENIALGVEGGTNE
ncbi:MAG: stage III sporulation protein AF [Bacillaceae bacterium]